MEVFDQNSEVQSREQRAGYIRRYDLPSDVTLLEACDAHHAAIKLRDNVKKATGRTWAEMDAVQDVLRSHLVKRAQESVEESRHKQAELERIVQSIS